MSYNKMDPRIQKALDRFHMVKVNRKYLTELYADLSVVNTTIEQIIGELELVLNDK